MRLIQIFKTNGIVGWRRNYKLLGKPDFVFPKLRVVVFTDGCFWHGHGCRKMTPAQNADYWRRKIERNRERDRLVTETLTVKNWRVIRVWECELKGGELPEKLSVLRELTGNLTSPSLRRLMSRSFTVR
ncbi:MAG: very short patch repair endonuclease [Cyanobacteriota bacterium]|nr:very short patch repair endonuclease [Cyanobacteriota bacterium]